MKNVFIHGNGKVVVQSSDGNVVVQSSDGNVVVQSSDVVVFSREDILNKLKTLASKEFKTFTSLHEVYMSAIKAGIYKAAYQSGMTDDDFEAVIKEAFPNLTQ